jgi:uncharacterized protein YndB with AHSA1/START domain
MTPEEEKASLKLERVIEIDADPETVWRALTEGEELKRWFPLDARVTPGVGGAVWLSWGEGIDWETPITVWEPGKHLRTVDSPSQVAVDYYIESHGGKTVLRLVHSGFSAESWDSEYDNLGAGWAAFLSNLKLYLEHHAGEPRTMVSYRHPPVEMPREEVFNRVMTALGLAGQELRKGGRYEATTIEGDAIAGEVSVYAPPVNFSGTVETLSNGFVIVEIEPGKTKVRPAIWLSLYGEAGKDAGALQGRIESLLQRAFA